MKSVVSLWLLLLAVLAGPAARAADGGVPAKPSPFTFVTDQAGLLQPADRQKLESGLSRYASSTGTPVIVVTVPSLGGMSVADMARQIGNTWQVGQSGKNNGLVVLVAKDEHKISIQPGSGLAGRITPAVTQQVIGEMGPSFKQGDYFAGLRKGLNTLMVTANPSSDPRRNAAAGTSAAAVDNGPASADDMPASSAAAPEPVATEPAEAPSTGLPWGTILLGGVIIIGGIFLLKRLFGGSSNSSAASYGGNRPGGNTPNFGAPNAPQGNYPPQQGGYGYGPQQGGSSGPGIGGMLATGAAAAAGAYLGNRLGGDHNSDAGGHNYTNDNNNGAGLGTGAAAGGAAAGGDYFAGRDGGNSSSNSGPDYFSGDDNSSSSGGGDYFSSDDSSSGGDTSGDFGGGDFNSSSDDNSGSW